MAEKKTIIPQKEFNKGFFLDVECCMCQNTATFAAYCKNDLKDILHEAGWRNLDSSLYGISGYYCGCDYKEDIKNSF